MGWFSCIIPSRRGRGVVLRFIDIKNGKLRFTTILNVGIGIIVPAGIEASDLPFNLEYSSNIAARVLKTGCWSAFRVSQGLGSLPAALSLRGRLPTYFSAKSPSCSARVVSRYCCLSYNAMQSSTGRLEARIMTTIISFCQPLQSHH